MNFNDYLEVWTIADSEQQVYRALKFFALQKKKLKWAALLSELKMSLAGLLQAFEPMFLGITQGNSS